MSMYGASKDSLFGCMEADGRTDAAFPVPYRADSPEAVKRDADEMTASGRRSAKCQAVLDALRAGPKTSDELAVACKTHRYSARIYDLRRMGFGILSTPLGGGRWLHTLTQDIEGEGNANH